MPDKRKHRGPHPHDAELFDRRHGPRLRSATADLCWLLSRDYPQVAAVKLVGDRYELRSRQRLAVQRCSCSDLQRIERSRKKVSADQLCGETVWVDGFNLLTTVESALAGGILLAAYDGCLRDMASVHGTFRIVEETNPALELIGSFFENLGVKELVWLLDAPVSNSGRLASTIRETAGSKGWTWQVALVANPDEQLQKAANTIVTADSVVLDRCNKWFNAAAEIVASQVSNCRPIDLAETESESC